jgi:hypothetical protein
MSSPEEHKAPAQIDLASIGNAADVRNRPPNEVNLQAVVALQAVALRNDHQIQLIKVATVAVVCVIFAASLGVSLYQSQSADRAALLKELQPYFIALLSFAGGAAAGRLAPRDR